MQAVAIPVYRQVRAGQLVTNPQRLFQLPLQILPTSSLNSHNPTGKREVPKNNLQSKSGRKKGCLPKSSLPLGLHSPLEHNQPTQRQQRTRVQCFNPQ